MFRNQLFDENMKNAQYLTFKFVFLGFLEGLNDFGMKNQILRQKLQDRPWPYQDRQKRPSTFFVFLRDSLIVVGHRQPLPKAQGGLQGGGRSPPLPSLVMCRQ